MLGVAGPEQAALAGQTAMEAERTQVRDVTSVLSWTLTSPLLPLETDYIRPHRAGTQ